jgi:hypothetical protein
MDYVESAAESYLNGWLSLDQARWRLERCGYESVDAVDYLTSYKDARLTARGE